MSSCVSPAASRWRASRRWWAVRLSRAPTQDRLVGARRRMADRVFEAGRRRRLRDNMRAKQGAQKPLREFSQASEPRQAGEAGGVLNLGTGDRGCCRGPLQQYVFRSSDVRGAAPWNPGHRWLADLAMPQHVAGNQEREFRRLPGACHHPLIAGHA